MGGREEIIKDLIQFTDQKCNSFRTENVCFVYKDSPGFQKQIQITYVGTHESKQTPTTQKQQCNLEDKGTNAFKIMMKNYLHPRIPDSISHQIRRYNKNTLRHGRCEKSDSQKHFLGISYASCSTKTKK